ncbi:MAG: hypothetical protein ACFFCS_25085 [Candidatus Hodarchaeota archaeon]
MKPRLGVQRHVHANNFFPADSRFTLLLILKAWLTWRPFALESLGRLRTAG